MQPERASEAGADFAELLLRAECGDAHAQHLIGLMLESGANVPQNQAAAWEWIRKAAEQGYAAAQMKLGLKCQRESRHVVPGKMDEAKIEAYMWFKLAAAHGGKKAVNSRDRMTFNMTHEEVNEGNRRAAAFLAGNIKNAVPEN